MSVDIFFVFVLNFEFCIISICEKAITYPTRTYVMWWASDGGLAVVVNQPQGKRKRTKKNTKTKQEKNHDTNSDTEPHQTKSIFANYNIFALN